MTSEFLVEATDVVTGCCSADLQSTDEENEPDLSKMTEKEKKEYLEKKAKRKAEREKKRKEKYGDKYDEMMQKHEKCVPI